MDGKKNTGNYNTGYCNTGDCNTGDRNTGYCNTGYRNTGDYNTGSLNTGDCNTNIPSVRIFNHDSGWEFYGDMHNRFRAIVHRLSAPLCEWVSESNMIEDEKKEHETYKTTSGYLKVNDNMRKDAEISRGDREFLMSIPNFSNEILKECTGIDLDNEKVKMVVDGKEIWISKESAEDIKKAFLS